MSVLFYDGVDHMIKKITTLFKGKADSSHKHTKSDITDFPSLGTASAKDVASSGNASTSQVVMGNDTRLTDARKASDVSAWAKASSKPSYTKSEIGLGNVDNTSDSSKPVSTAQQTAIDTAYANANKYTDKKVADLIGSAPETMDTLEEVAAAIQENKDVETSLNEAIGKKANQTELDTHTGNSTIHITASERTNWNAAKTHADSTHARTDATKVEKSSTNGNIKINGTETTVYTHPSGTNPHGTTKSDVGLGNVGNFKAVSTVANQGLSDTEKSNARTNIGAQVAGSYASSTHNHDDKYQAKGSYASASHTHDDRYYTESEVDSKLGGKANSSHTHTKSQITDFPTSMPASDVPAWAKASSKPSYTKSEVGLGNVDNTSDANKSVKYATSAGSANSAIKASGVADYNKTSNYIKVGYDGSGITGDEIRYIAGYTTGDSNSAARIKDVSKDALKSWLGLGSLAYSSATIPTIPSSLPANGGNASTVNGHTVNADVPSGAKFTDTTYTSKSAVSGGTDVSLVTTGEKATWNAKTSNTGTITGITMNGTSKGTSGVVDLGTVLTGGSQTSTSDEDGGENVYTFSDGSTIVIKNGAKGDAGTGGSNRLTYYETRPTSANKASSSDRVGSIEAFVASSSMTTGKPSADAKILQMNWDNTSGWDSQLAMLNDGTLQHRNMSSGKWQDWKTVLDSSNYKKQIGFETGTWNPILFDTASHEVIAQGAIIGNYYRMGDIVFIEAMMLTTSSYACHHISGLPYEPDHERPSKMYPIGIVSSDNGTGTNLPLNLISGSDSYYVQNGAYSSAKTYNRWYVSGWYRKA